MPTFPTTLPKVSLGQYGFQPVNTSIRTDMESGLPRVRRTSTATPTNFDVMWQLTLTQLGIFEKFYNVDLSGGAAFFDLKLVNGAGETTIAARFMEPYTVQASARELMWDVSARLETLTRPLIA